MTIATPAPAAKAAQQPASNFVSDLTVFQWVSIVFGLILIGIPLLIGIAQYFDYPIDFNTVSGGPKITDANLVPKFRVQFNTDELMAIGARFTNLGHVALMMLLTASFMTLVCWLGTVLMDDKENALGPAKGADYGSMIAKGLVLLIYIIGTPILGASISISASMMMSRDRDQKQNGMYTLIIAGILSVVILLIGNRYLMLGTIGAIGYYRMILNALMTLEKGNGIWLIELIDIVAFFYLMSQSQTDASGQAWKFGVGGLMAVVLGKVPFSGWSGEFFTTPAVRYYVMYRFIMTFILIFKEIGMSATTHRGGNLTVQMSSALNTILRLGTIALVTALFHYGAKGFGIIKVPTFVWLVVAICLIAFLEGYTTWLSRPVSGPKVDQDAHQNMDPLGGFFTVGPLRFWNAELEILSAGIAASCLFWPGFVAMFFKL